MLERISDLKFEDESVCLDGKHFVDCTFTDCTLEYSGDDVVFERTGMYNCRHVLVGHARQTANYMRLVGLEGVMKLRA